MTKKFLIIITSPSTIPDEYEYVCLINDNGKVKRQANLKLCDKNIGDTIWVFPDNFFDKESTTTKQIIEQIYLAEEYLKGLAYHGQKGKAFVPKRIAKKINHETFFYESFSFLSAGTFNKAVKFLLESDAPQRKISCFETILTYFDRSVLINKCLEHFHHFWNQEQFDKKKWEEANTNLQVLFKTVTGKDLPQVTQISNDVINKKISLNEGIKGLRKELLNEEIIKLIKLK